MQNLKEKIAGSKFYGVLLALFGLVLFAPQSQAVFVPVAFDPADMITQVTTTAGDVLPFVVALVAAGLVFKLIKRWAK